ncbi:hypothetical protein [Parabacteroides merdae]|nr:hypothetical protein [Parabacteroides merdae]DAZ54609.1 MAG TPA: hypothetical protein [Caudoviricetes sp.]
MASNGSQDGGGGSGIKSSTSASRRAGSLPQWMRPDNNVPF